MTAIPARAMSRPTLALALVFAAITPAARAQDYQHATTGTRILQSAGGLSIKVLVEASNLGGNEVELAEITFPVGAGTARRGHRHGAVEIFYVLEGRLDHIVNGQSHLIGPGKIGIVRPGDDVVHRVMGDTPVRALVIWAPGGEVGRIATALGGGVRRAQGDLYVANIGSNEVTVYDGTTGVSKGVFVAAGAGGLQGATGIAFGPDGHLYVGSSQTNQVLRYDGATGAPLGAFVDDSALAMPFSLIFGPDGHLYVSSGRGHTVRRYDGRTGSFLNVAATDSTLQQPIGLRFGPDRMLYVVNSAGKNVMRFDPSTARGTVFASDSLGFPSDLVFGPDGALYVSNASKGTVARFDGVAGTFRDVYARLPEGAAPVGLAFTADGRLFVGDFAGSRLFMVPAGGGEPELVATEGLVRPENMTVQPR